MEIRRKLNILVLYDDGAVDTRYVSSHASSFGQFSHHTVHYLPVTRRIAQPENLSGYDALIIHFTVRLPFDFALDHKIATAISNFDGVKIAMPQDEYDLPLVTAKRFVEFGIDVVGTTVPADFRDAFYPPEIVGDLQYFDCLTGYVCDDVVMAPFVRAFDERRPALIYRGRTLPVWYGSLGQEKLTIGTGMRFECEQNGISADIETDEFYRIAGEDWFHFVGSARAMLSSESGSNVVDKTGSIREACQKFADDNPDVDEGEIYTRIVEPHDGKVRMNQISPKVFEAIQLKTGLVLFEGAWSGILQPDIHYIPLKKDFSNVNEVFRSLTDDNVLKPMIDRAYQDIVETGDYSYAKQVGRVDTLVENFMIKKRAGYSTPGKTVTDSKPNAFSCPAEFQGKWPDGLPLSQPFPAPAPNPRDFLPILRGSFRKIWLLLPNSIRAKIIGRFGSTAVSINKLLRK